MEGFATWILEAAGPLNFIGAQLIYIGKPFLNPGWEEHAKAIARLLEDEEEARAFIEYLKGSTP